MAAERQNGHSRSGLEDALPAPSCTCGGPADDGTCTKCGKAAAS
jgi:hypothetical protein